MSAEPLFSTTADALRDAGRISLTQWARLRQAEQDVRDSWVRIHAARLQVADAERAEDAAKDRLDAVRRELGL